MPARYVLVIMGFFGFACAFSIRVILNVAIVAMVKEPTVNIHPELNESIVACPELIMEIKNHNNSMHIRPIKVQGEFEWDSNMQGVILGSFYYGYFITQFPGGIMSEKCGGKWIFGIGILISSLLSLLTPFAARWSASALIALRVGQGLGQGISYPAMYTLMGLWAPKLEISRISSLVNSGNYIGAVVSMYISGILCESNFLGGWPSAFYVFGILGCIWFVLWIILAYDSPATHPRISKEELSYIQPEEHEIQPQKSPAPWKSIFTSVPVWGLIITHTSSNWAFYTLITDLPIYLSGVLHYDVEKSGTLSAATSAVPVFFIVLSSVIVDKLIENGRLETSTIRKLVNSLGLYVASICVLIVAFIGCQPVAILLCLALAVGTNGFTNSGFLVTHVDMSPEFAGTLMGITNCAANLPGFLAPSIVGYLIQDGNTLANWRKVFIVTSVSFFVSGTVYNIMCTSEKQSWGTNQQPDEKINDSKKVESSHPVTILRIRTICD